MDKDEALKKAQSKRAIIGEMEYSKIATSNWIAVISMGGRCSDIYDNRGYFGS